MKPIAVPPASKFRAVGYDLEQDACTISTLDLQVVEF